jgi:hypothetical protein
MIIKEVLILVMNYIHLKDQAGSKVFLLHSNNIWNYMVPIRYIFNNSIMKCDVLLSTHYFNTLPSGVWVHAPENFEM